MTLARRVAALETALSPTQLVLVWLDEAHAFGDLESYTRSLLDVAPDERPIDRLVRQAEEGARAGLRGRGRDWVDAAVRSALMESVFCFELVLRINTVTHEILDREALLQLALSAHLSLLVSEDPRARAEAAYRARLGRLRDLIAARPGELRAAQEARATVEGRYLDGHPALFPDLAQRCAEQLTGAEGLADLASRIAEMNGLAPASAVDPEALAGPNAARLADLVEPAKVTALDKLGEGRRASDIATAWVRSKLEPVTPSSSDGETGS